MATPTFDRLSEMEKGFVATVSVFAGGFTVGAATAVCTDGGLVGYPVGEVAAELARRGAAVRAGGSDTRPRYRLDDRIRAGGQAELVARGHQDGAWSRLLAWARALAEEGAAGLEGPEQPAWLQRLELENDNLRAALGWGVARADCEDALGLAGALGRYWEMRGQMAEGRKWLADALRQNPAASRSARAGALNSAGLLALRSRDLAGAQAAYEESLAVHWDLGDRLGSAGVLHSLGNLAFQQRDWDEAGRLFEESLVIGRELQDRRVIAASLTNIGAVAEVRGDRAAARRCYDESLEAWRAQGDTHNLLAVLGNLVTLTLAERDLVQARHFAEEALAAHRLLADQAGTASTLGTLARIADLQGDQPGAVAFRNEYRALAHNSPGPQGGGWLARFRRRLAGGDGP